MSKKKKKKKAGCEEKVGWRFMLSMEMGGECKRESEKERQRKKEKKVPRLSRVLLDMAALMERDTMCPIRKPGWGTINRTKLILTLINLPVIYRLCKIPLWQQQHHPLQTGPPAPAWHKYFDLSINVSSPTHAWQEPLNIWLELKISSSLKYCTLLWEKGKK